MKYARLAERNKKSCPESFDLLYECEVVALIRKRYSLNRELAIIRQRDIKAEEFAEYNEYVEECKKAVRAEMDGEHVEQ